MSTYYWHSPAFHLVPVQAQCVANDEDWIAKNCDGRIRSDVRSVRFAGPMGAETQRKPPSWIQAMPRIGRKVSNHRNVRKAKARSGRACAEAQTRTGGDRYRCRDHFHRRLAQAVAPSGKAVGLDIEPDMVAYMQADAKKLGVKNYHARVVKPDDPNWRQAQRIWCFSATRSVTWITAWRIFASWRLR